MRIRLMSFKLCPFVQRAVIALEEKGVDYELEFIELDHPPQWFKQRSPLGKVPLMLVDNSVLFESAVILGPVNTNPIRPAGSVFAPSKAE